MNKVEQVTYALEQGHPLRICKKCRHYVDNKQCDAMTEAVLDLVTGNKIRRGQIYGAHMMREGGPCGKEGKMWKARLPMPRRIKLLWFGVACAMLGFIACIFLLSPVGS